MMQRFQINACQLSVLMYGSVTIPLCGIVIDIFKGYICGDLFCHYPD